MDVKFRELYIIMISNTLYQLYGSTIYGSLVTELLQYLRINWNLPKNYRHQKRDLKFQ